MAADSSGVPESLQAPNEGHTAWFLRRVWDRVNRDNEHWVAAIVGREGSGKSYTALKIADSVDPTFTHERVIFDVAELLKVLKNGDHEPGQFYVLDEAGVQLGRRTWQERGQVLANQALQLIRSHNLGLIFTLPRLSELDSQAQGRLQAFFEITKKVPDQYVRVKTKIMDPDRSDSTGEIYKKYPRRESGPGAAKEKVRRMGFTPPRDQLVEPYEKTKRKFQEEFYEKTIQELDGDADGEDQSNDEKTVKDIALEIAKGDVSKVVSEHGNTGEPYINAQLIRAHYELSHDDSKAVKSLLNQQIELSDDMV